MYTKETYINRSENVMIGESDFLETWTDNIGELFRSLQKEYGRAQKMFIDDPDTGAPKQVGWVFTGKDHYTDTGEPYTREVWVEVHEKEPDIQVTKYYYPF